jgi:hypothetical protein
LVKPTPEHHGNGSHEPREREGGEQALDDTEDGGRKLLNEAEEAEHFHQRIDVGYGADKGGRDGPEDDGDGDEAQHEEAAHDLLPPLHPQRAPNDLFGPDANKAWRHVQRLVMGQDLVGGLGVDLRVKLDEGGAQRGTVSAAMLPAQLPNVSVQCLDPGPCPSDGVNTATKVGEGTVVRALLDGNPERRDGAPDVGQRRIESVGVRVFEVLGFLGGGIVENRQLSLGEPEGGIGLALLCVGVMLLGVALLGGRGQGLGLHGDELGGVLLEVPVSCAVRHPDQPDLGLLEQLGSLFPVLHQATQEPRVSRDPDILGRVAKELAQLGLFQVLLGDACEQDSPRRQPLGVVGR